MRSRRLTVPCFFWRSLAIISLLMWISVSETHAQNLVINSSFTNGSSTGWSTSGSLEINPQSVYGGTSSTDYSTELDVERTINQKVCILPGLAYTLTFQASRRIDAVTPTNPGLQVIVTGVPSNTQYVNNIKAYNNTVWSAQNANFTFSVPSGSTDKQVNIQFLSNNNSGTYGVIVWDIELAPAATNPLSIAGPENVLRSSPAGFSVTNAPATAVYSWSFSGANTSTSTNAIPTGITWSHLGAKTVSTTLSNGTCSMASYTKAVTVVAVLPVQWSNFEGAIINQNAHLSWITQNESNGHYFIIQRSLNSIDFDSVAVVASLNANTAHSYSFTDQHTPTGRFSYRLKCVDFDNHIQYSSIVSLDKDPVTSVEQATISPNPATSTLMYTLNSERQGQVSICIFNLSGVLVMSSAFHLTTGVNQTILNISRLQPGTYFLSTSNAQTGARVVRTFVKG